METSTATDKIKIVETAIKGVITGALLFGTYKVYKHFSDKSKADAASKKESDNIPTDTNASAASHIQKALPTDLVSRMIGGSVFTNADEQKLIELFRNMKSADELKKIQDSYKLQTGGRSLMDDLKKQMQAKYFEIITNTIQALTGQKVSQKSKIGFKQFIVAISDVNVRKNPISKRVTNANSPIFASETKKNIIKLAKANTRLGLSTGKEFYDPEGDTWFVEIMIPLDWDTKKPAYVYVAKSKVKGYNNTKDIPPIYSQKIKITSEEFKDADILEGLENKLVSTKHAIIYYTDFRPISQVKPNVLLGTKVMELMGKGKTMIQFRTVQGDLRWVEKNSTKVKN